MPLLATDLEGILDKTVIDKLLMVQSRPEDNKLDLLILPLPYNLAPDILSENIVGIPFYWDFLNYSRIPLPLPHCFLPA